MINQFSRTELLVGKEAIKKLNNSKVAVFGIGGVGSFAVECLIRAGIENIVLIDNDEVSLTNLNRQLEALHSTIGQSKVEVMKQRILDINPNVKVETYNELFMPGNTSIINNSLDYVVDCVDMVTAKIEIIKQCKEKNISVISCMGTGNKMNPTMLEVSDIYKTSVCPLAKVMRKELKARKIDSLKVVYSKEEPKKAMSGLEQFEEENKKQVPGSISFVPSVAGMIIASEVIKDILYK